MPKFTTPAILLGALLTLNGCGGSSNPTEPAAGSDTTHFDALMPDGTPMAIVIDRNENGMIGGSYAVAATTGPYAGQAGSFIGTATGGRIDAQCYLPDGKTFSLQGTNEGGKTLTLTRSDLPGKTLTFRPTKVNEAPSTRANLTFFTDGGGTTGRMQINSTPFAVHNGGAITEYRGIWNTMEVTVWAYSTGLTMVVTRLDGLCLQTSYFLDYPVSAFPTKTVTSGNGQVTFYHTGLRSQIKFKTSVVASP